MQGDDDLSNDCKALTAALQKLKKESLPNRVALSDIRDRVASMDALRAHKRTHGSVIVSNAFTENAMAAARVEALNAWWRDVAPQIPNAKLPPRDIGLLDLTKKTEWWPTGIIGNAGFGYLIAHPELTAEMPSVTLSTGMKITVAMGSAYKANLALVSHSDSQLAMAILYAVSENRNGVVSQDFCKIHRGELTKAHVDIYEDNEKQIHRMQAIAFGPGEGTVRLCYLLFSHLPEIQTLVTRIIGVDIYGTKGFQKVPTDKQRFVLAAFKEADCIECGNPYDLVMWEPGVIHVELKLDEREGFLFKADNKTTTERYVVGIHNMTGFTPQEVVEVAHVAEQGFVFHPYNSANAGKPAGTNSVHRKRTQWKKPRQRTADEKNRLAAVQTRLEQHIELGIACKRKKHCLGIIQVAEEMYDDKIASQIHME